MTQEDKELAEAKKQIHKMIKNKEPIPVTQIIQVHMIFDNGHARGWVHTHGMHEVFDLPDLEIIGVHPLFMMSEAGRLLNHVAQYMVDALSGIRGAKPVKAGQTFGVNPLAVIRFVESTPIDKTDQAEIDTHYTTPRLRLVEVPEMLVCNMGGHKADIGSGRN